MKTYVEIYEEASIGIDEMIAQLEEAKQYGATHVVGLNGNYLGARCVSFGEITLEDDEVYY